jgi:glutamine synthetase
MTLAGIDKAFSEKSIKHVKIGGFDVDGVLRGKYVSTDKFRAAAEGGLGFCDVIFGWDMGDLLYDNATVTGWHTGYPDAQARIDLDTFRVIPWEPDTACFLLDFFTREGKPHPASPRALLRSVVDRAAQAGLRAVMSLEYEFFFFRETPHSLREKGYRDLAPLSPGMFGYSWLRSSQAGDLTHAILDGCRAYDLELEGFHTETGPGVYEAAILYDDALRAADKAALFKTAVKEIASRHGLVATFMAKWNAGLPGCGGHIHQSLWDPERKKNLFFDAAQGLSALARHYLGGQLRLLPDLDAFFAPTVNSYKRRVENTWAPTSASWGVENRTTAIRAIPGGEKSTRLEFRVCGADVNPYLGMAANLAAGLFGIERKIEPGAPCAANAYGLSPEQAPPLGRSLHEAIARLAQSAAARDVLSPEAVDHYLRTRQWEARRYEQAVTDWELDRYFEIV